jgi:hypothetical protein
VNLLTDLADFLRAHRPQGCLTADATEPAWNDYLLTVACLCGVVFGRWVTPEDAMDGPPLGPVRESIGTRPKCAGLSPAPSAFVE